MELEVEYLNRYRHGKEKIYCYDEKLIFEGDDLNGYKHGKGKEYDYDYNGDDNLEFEGEYFYGKRWNRKGDDNNNNIMYELKNGKGHIKKYYLIGKLFFENDF